MTEETSEKTFNRSETINGGLKILKKIEGRLNSERFRTYDTDRDFLQFVRAYASLLTAVNSVVRDNDLDEMRKDLDSLMEKEGVNR